MTRRILGGLLASVILVVPLLFGLDTGKAEGTITINRKPVKLLYSFARKEKNYDKKDEWTVIVTDRPVSRAVLADDQRFRKAVENGEVVAAVFRWDEGKTLELAEVRSKALQHKSLPLSVSDLKLTGLTFGKDAVEGSATIADQEFFTDVAAVNFKFRAPLGIEGKFGDNPASATALAANAPKIADGGATGTLKVDGATVKLAHSIARSKPNAFDEKKKDVVVLLTDKPVDADTFINDDKLFGEASKGAIQGLLVTIDSDEKPYHLQVLHPKATIQISGSGFWNFDATDFSDKHLTGKFYTTSEQDFMDKHKYSYNVTFAAPVQNIALPGELSIDASNGTKLPAGGGDPGKAYIAFDKAARSGNLKEMTKYGSKTRPMPDFTPEEMKEMAAMIKAMRPAKMKIVDGYVSGDQATLLVDAEDSDKSKMKGTIEMTREDGSWRLLKEKWKQ